jgi:hypothetical protein
MAHVFISYRRSDAGGHAGRLFDRLIQWFDRDAIFYDLDSIDSGDVFPERLETAVKGANVVLIVIGPDWLDELNRRALLPAADFVRLEIESALRTNAPDGTRKIIPVLLGGAKLPALGDLHATLREGFGWLPSIDVHEFHGKNADWDQQFARLCELIAAVPGVPAPRYRQMDKAPGFVTVVDRSVSTGPVSNSVINTGDNFTNRR